MINAELADFVFRRVEEVAARHAAQMPDEGAALSVMMSAFERLRALGWRDAAYIPRDGVPVQVIEMGSTGTHECVRHEDGSCWSWDGEGWPMNPCLFRPLLTSVE